MLHAPSLHVARNKLQCCLRGLLTPQNIPRWQVHRGDTKQGWSRRVCNTKENTGAILRFSKGNVGVVQGSVAGLRSESPKP